MLLRGRRLWQGVWVACVGCSQKPDVSFAVLFAMETEVGQCRRKTSEGRKKVVDRFGKKRIRMESGMNFGNRSEKRCVAGPDF